MPNPLAIDLFSGCGGFALGAQMAGFSIKLSIDIDETLSSSYKLNFPGVQHENWDISKTFGSAIKEAVHGEDIDLIIGGPPCQGFSEIGRNQAGDPRNSLVGHFFRCVAEALPKVFVMENVPGILARAHKDLLGEAMEKVQKKYHVLEPMQLRASDYGAATVRDRVVVVGYRKNEFPNLTPNDFTTMASSNHQVTVKEALVGLPTTRMCRKERNSWGFAKLQSVENFSECKYSNMLRAAPPKGLGSMLARRMLDKEFVSGNHDTAHKPETTMRFEKTSPGSCEPVSRYYKLSNDKPCPTLRAGTGPDRGSHQAARPIHPSEPRVITVREAARLQGFPDWFLFHPTKWHSFRMIGNSVSPIFSRALLEVVLPKLANREQSSRNAA